MRVRRDHQDQPTTPIDTMSEESKLARALILQVLYEQGDWLADRVVRKLFSAEGIGMDTRLGIHLGYLEEEGLIREQRRIVGKAQFSFYRITSRGIDVYEGTTEHPGVGRRPE